MHELRTRHGGEHDEASLAGGAGDAHLGRTMKTTKKSSESKKDTNGRASRIETAAVTGAVAGAAAGALAGPVGAVAGAVAGSAMGAMAGVALADDSDRRHARERVLDRETGVTEGDLGAADPSQPPAKRGTYSAGSAGAGSTSGSTPSEGPIQDVDD
jgi:hypothetical protein